MRTHAGSYRQLVSAAWPRARVAISIHVLIADFTRAHVARLPGEKGTARAVARDVRQPLIGGRRSNREPASGPARGRGPAAEHALRVHLPDPVRDRRPGNDDTA